MKKGRARTVYVGTSVVIGRPNNQNGVLTLNNSSNTNTTSFQAGAAAASRTYTWPTDFGAAGSVLTDAAGNGTLSWAVPTGTIGGSIAANQVAYGSGANTVAGSNNLYWDFTNNRLGINQASPQYSLDVTGAFRATSQSGTTAANGLWTGNNAAFDGSNYERMGMIFLSNVATLLTDAAGTGTQRTFQIKQGSVVSYNANVGYSGFGANASTAQQVIITPSSSSTIGQTIKLAVSQSADALQVQNSSGTILSNFNPSGFLGVGFQNTNTDVALWVKGVNFSTATTLFHFYTGGQALPSTNTGSAYGYYGYLTTSATAYTLGNSVVYRADTPVIGAGSAITNSHGFFVNNMGASGVTNASGVTINAQSGATNNTAILS